MTWNGKTIKLFLFGDYDFLLKLYGISGAQSVHPCLWCKASKCQIQKSPTQQPAIPARSLSNIKNDYQRYRCAGKPKKKARLYHNVITAPILDIALQQVNPPYLHLKLGIVKKHHELLEKDYHTLDEKIAQSPTLSELSSTSPAFQNYVKQSAELRQKESDRAQIESQSMHIIVSDDNKAKKQQVYDLVDKLNDQIQDIKKNLDTLPFRSGPVAANLDTELKRHKISVQAYHGRSFIGNHCNKYLKKGAYDNICDSVVRVTKAITNDSDIHACAERIQVKFQTLNQLYSKVHSLISHKNPVHKDMYDTTDRAINEYMTFFRQAFPSVNIIPKQHILETHCLPWIRSWGFGLGLHGEQGGEEVHATVNRLKCRAWGIQKDSDRLTVLMWEQLTLASPLLHKTPPKKKKLSLNQ